MAYVKSKIGGHLGLGFRVEGLGLRGCREKCENGREKNTMVHNCQKETMGIVQSGSLAINDSKST